LDEPTTPAPKRKRNARAGKPPAFSFFAADWLADKEVRKMSPAERGLYIDLLAYSWREHGLDADPEENRRLLNLRRGPMWIRAWQRISARFSTELVCGCGEIHASRMFNERLEKERKAQREFADEQKARAAMRWHDSGIHPALPEASRSHALLSAPSPAGREGGVPSRDGEPRQTEALPVDSTGPPTRKRRSGPLSGEPDAFTRFYQTYPLKEDRRGALVAWKRIDPDSELAETIIASVEAWKQSRRWREGVILHPKRFLDQRRWESIPPSAGDGQDAWDKWMDKKRRDTR